MIVLAIILGIIEGATEFLPISSTGHLIIAGHLLDFKGPTATSFEIFIQLGAILAVVWEYRARFISVVTGITSPVTGADSRRFISNLIVAFIPAGVAGLLLHGTIQRYLFSPLTVGGALVVGGVAMIVIEKAGLKGSVDSVGKISWKTALAVGFAQTLALFPGVSRAAATIMGGMFAKLDRRTATEFSFFLAIPTMFAATLYDLWKSRGVVSVDDISWFAVGFVTAFISALIAVRAFIRYVSRHDFKPFGWYRIVFGSAVLGYFLIRGY